METARAAARGSLAPLARVALLPHLAHHGARARLPGAGDPPGPAHSQRTYGNVYVAQVAFGANPAQTVKAFAEAEAYNGPSLIIAYSTCIAHGIDMSMGIDEQKKAVACGHWPLYRYSPELERQGKNPLTIDSKEPSISFEEYAYGETRYKALKAVNPALAADL